jgi:hypothetical protein
MVHSNAVHRKTALSNQPVIFRMGTNPEPYDAVGCIHTNGSIVEADTSRPETPHLLEMYRRVLRVCLQKFESFVGLFTERSRKGVVASPEIR